jgi:hypothetical protein
LSGTTCHALPRLAAALLGHLLLFVWFPELSKWRSLEHEAWKSFRIGGVAAIILVLAITVIVRGKAQEIVAAGVLCLLPAFCLLGTLLRFLGWS